MNGFNLGLNDMSVIVIKSRFFFPLWVWREDRLGNQPLDEALERCFSFNY